MLDRPLGIYINWSAYDELSDAVQLDQDLAMRQLDHLLRLRRAGARLDAYIMDCFWYDPDGAYRTWRTPHWRDQGEGWLKACRDHGVLPGLWFGCNSVGKWMGLHRHPRWADSIESNPDPAAGGGYCLFEGPYLPDLMAAFDHWYGRGVRVFKLDFLNQQACLPHHRLAMLPREVRAANATAFRCALGRFRREHPEAVVIGYNGYEDENSMNGTWHEPHRSLDSRWLEGLDGFYTGDPRPADVPTLPFWRSKDIYSDHQVRHFLAQGFDRRVLDNAGFMIGTTGTCYGRGTAAWQGMLLLSLARGGWLNTYYGNLDLLDDADAAWFARAQALFWPFLSAGRMTCLGGLPGRGAIYGFHHADERGALSAVVNAGMVHQEIELPSGGRILFRDAGAAPGLAGTRLRLGPSQMALVGHGDRADAAHDLGIGADAAIPAGCEALPCAPAADGATALRASVQVPAGRRLRLVMTQTAPDGKPRRTSGGAPPKGTPLGRLLTLEARQDGRALAVAIDWDKAIWSGLSWAVGEVAAEAIAPGRPVEIRAASAETQPTRLELRAYAVS